MNKQKNTIFRQIQCCLTIDKIALTMDSVGNKRNDVATHLYVGISIALRSVTIINKILLEYDSISPV